MRPVYGALSNSAALPRPFVTLCPAGRSGGQSGGTGNLATMTVAPQSAAPASSFPTSAPIPAPQYTAGRRPSYPRVCALLGGVALVLALPGALLTLPETHRLQPLTIGEGPAALDLEVPCKLAVTTVSEYACAGTRIEVLNMQLPATDSVGIDHSFARGLRALSYQAVAASEADPEYQVLYAPVADEVGNDSMAVALELLPAPGAPADTPASLVVAVLTGGDPLGYAHWIVAGAAEAGRLARATEDAA